MENEAAYAAGLIAASLMGAGYYANRAHAEGVRNRAIALGFLIALPLRLLLSRAFAFFAQLQYLLPTEGWMGLLDMRPQGYPISAPSPGCCWGAIYRNLSVNCPATACWIQYHRGP